MTDPLQLAVRHYNAGRAADAEAACRRAVSAAPANADAWYLLGTLAAAGGRAAEAVDHFTRAIALRPEPHFLYARGSTSLGLGEGENAVTDFRRATAARPSFAEGFYGLGTALRGLGRMVDAVDAFRSAASARPGWADPLNACGVVLREIGRVDEAEAAYRSALSAQPNHLQACWNLGNLLRARKDLAGAIDVYRRSIEIDPRGPAGYDLLGGALSDAGRWDESIATHRAAVARAGGWADGHNHLGAALMLAARHAAGAVRMSEAVQSFERAFRLEPKSARFAVDWGNALTESGDPAAAVAPIETALALDPNSADAWSALGLARSEMGLVSPALEAFDKAAAIDPGHFDARVNGSVALLAAGRPADAEAAARRALSVKPGSAVALNALANALKDQGEIEEAIATARAAVGADPADAAFHSNLVFDLHFLPESTAALLRNEAEAWGLRHATEETPLFPKKFRPAADARLRIGYLSPDFTGHAVGRFILPVIQRHAKDGFEVHCFSNNLRDDVVTPAFRQACDRWHDVRRLDDADLARLVADNKIDLLVDLAVHTAGNRLAVFGRRPAPVQASYLGYCGTTGVAGMDYALVDPRLIPPGDARAFTEEPVVLPKTYWCYRPPAGAPPVSPSPVTTLGHVTFGCLNNFAKVNSGVLDRWADILSAVPGSRLFVHAKAGGHRDRVIARLGARGVTRDRVDFFDGRPLSAYLAAYGRVDVALDPFPFNGGTTTCDALWMGVPVVTFAGRTPVGRAGLSVLTAAGLPELAAADDAGHVRSAIELALDSSRLAGLRSTLRDRLSASALTDEAGFVSDLEAAYERMIEAGPVSRL